MCTCNKNKISGMKKISVKSVGDKIVPIATMAVGFAIAKVIPWVVNKVAPSSKGLSNTVVGLAEVGTGILISSMKNKHLANVGTGIAISGAHTFLADPVKQALEAAGIKGINGYQRGNILNFETQFHRMAQQNGSAKKEFNPIN